MLEIACLRQMQCECQEGTIFLSTNSEKSIEHILTFVGTEGDKELTKFLAFTTIANLSS